MPTSEPNTEQPLDSTHMEYLLKEYELLRNSMLERSHRLYLANSIMFTASVLIILGCLQSKEEMMNRLSVPIGAVLLSMIGIMLALLLYLHISAVKVSKRSLKQ